MKAITRKIPVANDFSFSECLWFLNRNFDDCMHTTGQDFIRKALRIDDQEILLEIKLKGKYLEVELLEGVWDQSNEHVIVQFVLEWLEPQRNIKPFYQLLEQAPELAYMSKSFAGLRLIGIPDLFEALAWSMIGQQINLTFAYKLKRRLVEKYGKAIRYQDSDYALFPSAETLANAHVEDLRQMQFSQKKAEYIIGLAKKFLNQEISKPLLLAMPNLANRQKALTNIRGIGIWTANYALMKSLREPTCIPYGDAGLLNALLRHNLIEQKTDVDGLNSLFEKFPSWESYLVFYLWRSLAPFP